MTVTCEGCPECLRETRSELVGKAAAIKVLNDSTLTRVCARGATTSTPDYESSRSVVEVKEFLSSTMARYTDAMAKQPVVQPVNMLSKTWHVMPEVLWEWNTAHDQTPRVKDPINRLAPLLAEFEALRIHDRRRAPIPLLFELSAVIGRGYCVVGSKIPGYGPSVVLGQAISGVRSGDIDEAIADPVQTWLDHSSSKMVESLQSAEGRRACGVLVLPPT
ncbi:hypothetical protein [Gordonia rhizosphera]|uniref:hypothetical protein n=1 Tax=Gordonia rhizosphera TaxID=83341 RepID=UPI0012F68568|nr:hypothetical protein [Gordonia rhizosphera]